MHIPSPDRHFYEFGPFRFDPHRHRLFRDGLPVHVSPKAMETLRVFVQNPGKLLEREQLMQAVWSDTFVEDANLTVAVSQLRKALGQMDDNDEYIETLPRVGYRFLADVRVVREAPLRIEKHTLSQTVIEEEVLEDSPRVVTKSIVLPTVKTTIAAQSLSRKATWAIGLCIVSLGVLTAVVYFRFSKAAKPSDPSAAITAIRSIAVLPPRAFAPGDENLSLSLGLADALITRLGSVQRLTVTPTSSVYRYVDRNYEAIEVGRSLGVDAVLDGTLQLNGNGVRVTWRLIDTHTGGQLWSRHFNEGSVDIFQLQDNVSREVSEALFPNLTTNEKLMLLKRPTANPEAYASYLKGNYFWNQRADQVQHSVPHYRRAIELDPNFAEAYAGLAAVRSTMENPSPEAEALAEKALELNDSLSLAHATYGFIQMFHHWNWVEAESALDRAIQLDPNSVTAHHWKGVYLSLRGRLNEAKSEMRRALELDPLSLIVMADLGQLYYFTHDYDQAIEYCNRALALKPDFEVAQEYLADLYRLKGMEDEAANAWVKRRFTDSLSIEAQQKLFRGKGLQGLIKFERDVAVKSADETRAFVIAKDSLRLGEPGEALDWLEVVFKGRKWHWQPYLNVDPIYDPIRNQPRFQTFLKQMRLT